jgi:PAS domain S-box-containing protein
MSDHTPRLLLVEDNPTDALLVREALSDAPSVPFVLTQVERLAEGLEHLAATECDVVLLDLGLPDSQGLETFLKIHDAMPSLPIVVLTGLVDEEMGIRAVQHGAQDYLVKGEVDGQLLVRALRYAIERKRAEQMFRGLLEAAPDAMIILDQAGQILLVNAQAEQLFGYTRQGLLGESIERLVPGRFRNQQQIQWAGYLADPRTQPIGGGLELYARRKDGSEFPVEICLSPLETDEGRVAISTMRDLSQTHRWQELEILYALDRVMAQANRPTDVVRIAAEQALPLLGFDAAAALLLDPRGEVLRLLHAHALPPEVRMASESIPVGSSMAGRAVAERQPVLLSIEDYPEIGLPPLADALREAGFLTVAATPFLAHGQVYGALALLSHQRLQPSPHMVSLLTAVGTQIGLAVSHAAERERLGAQERLAALGRLAAGVAHELNTPLSRLLLELEILRSDVAGGQSQPSELLSESIPSLEEAAGQMKRIMQGLSTYAKPPRPEPTLLQVGDLLAATRELIAYPARQSRVRVAVETRAMLAPVLGDRSQLMQVLVNLATNAIEAMAETGGHLTLRARVQANSVEQQTGFQRSALSASVIVEVADTGPGISPELLPQIWEPFYTTKPEGTGLGLAIVRSLVAEQPGASIEVESRPGEGTTFTLMLPVAHSGDQPPTG